jgi:uncharacterized protein involved in exopolysaccharide biosynthesis
MLLANFSSTWVSPCSPPADVSPMQTEPEGNEEEEQRGGGLNVEVLRSYGRFAQRALVRRKVLIAAVATVGTVLTLMIASLWPRTFSCQTVMITTYNGVLDSNQGPQPLAGAELVTTRENLEALIKSTNLTRKYVERRPPLLEYKARIMAAIFGPLDEKVLSAIVVGTLQTRLELKAEKDKLTITADWTDGKTAAELAEAARESFLRIRNRTETSAFQEKMSILDAHAATLRDEIEGLAKQARDDLSAKRAEIMAEAKSASGTTATSGSVDAKRPPAASPRSLPRRSKPATDAQLPELKERLAALKTRLTQAESDRSRQITEQQGKLEELKLRLMPNHPQVITQEERVNIASQVSSELAMMRGEVSDLEAQIRQRTATANLGQASSGSSGSAGGTTAAGDTGALPTEILGLLDQPEVDPAMYAQMSGAIARYGSLRDEVRGSKLALDTAQAAFNHRYQVVTPVEEPNRPIKPKVPVIYGVGLALSLLLAFLLPLLLELKRDVLVERWQVQGFQLPVLAELRLPPSSKDQG